MPHVERARLLLRRTLLALPFCGGGGSSSSVSICPFFLEYW
jgi:hypothetical protein